MTLSDLIADVRRKAVEAKATPLVETMDQLARHVWLEYLEAASPDLIIQMADRFEELEKALKPFADAWKGERPSSWFFTFEEMEAASHALNGEKP